MPDPYSSSSPSTPLSSPASPLFLREPEIRRGIELLFFAHAELMGSGDAVLTAHALGRAHHRALYFIARKPGLAIGELMQLLGVTKQSLGRVLGELEERGFITREKGQRDRRQILVRLSPAGEKLEAELFARFRSKMIAAYGEAGPASVTGFWKVLEELLTNDMRKQAAELSNPGN
jgi:DNA-binding MarR family transcriptional regulator